MPSSPLAKADNLLSGFKIHGRFRRLPQVFSPPWLHLPGTGFTEEEEEEGEEEEEVEEAAGVATSEWQSGGESLEVVVFDSPTGNTE